MLHIVKLSLTRTFTEFIIYLLNGLTLKKSCNYDKQHNAKIEHGEYVIHPGGLFGTGRNGPGEQNGHDKCKQIRIGAQTLNIDGQMFYQKVSHSVATQ